MAGIIEWALIVVGAVGALWGLSSKKWLLFLIGLALAVFGFILM